MQSTAALRKWGNSFGVIIPIEQIKAAGAYLGEEFQVRVKTDGSIVLKPVDSPQAGWLEAFNAAADQGQGVLLLEDTETDFDRDEWTW